MATYTTNYNLKKPASSDYALISDINGNMDTIDGALNTINGKLTKIYANKTASSWSADSTYSDYGYKCDIAITGVTANDVAWVTFGVTEATSGDYAPICATYSGGVRVYSKVNTSITIPTILVFKA